MSYVQSIGGVNPHYYGNYNFKANNVPVTVQQPLTMAQPAQTDEFISEANNEDPSLLDQCVSNVALFGGIKAIPHIRRPIKSAKGIKEAWKIYAENAEAFKTLSDVQKGEAFSTLFNTARLNPRIVKPELSAKLTELQANYINALKGKNPVEIAKTGAELKAFAARSKNGSIINGVKNMYYNFKNPLPVAEGTGFWGKATNRVRGTFRGPSVEMSMMRATKDGAAAEKIAKAANEAAEAAKGLKGFQKASAVGKQWFKQGGGWFAVGIEGAMQVPELIAAYSEGEKGDGIKQTVKSAATVGINTAGWIAGAKFGAVGGTKLGAIIGSFFAPGPGTAIGAALGGFLGSLVGMATGSWAAGKTSKALVGKSFTEKQAEKQAKQQQLAQQIYLSQQKNNPNYAINPFYQQGMYMYKK